MRREQLKQQIEYFNLDSSNKDVNGFPTVHKQENGQIHRQSRRIIGYTLGRSTTQIKEKLIKMLTHSKKSMKPKKRSNSSENILQMRDETETQSQNPGASTPAHLPLGKLEPEPSAISTRGRPKRYNF